MNIFVFLSGVGVQELILILLFLGMCIGIPVLVIILIVKSVRRHSSRAPIVSVEGAQTPILRNADKLRELKSLQEKGIISNDEFEAEKKKILLG